MGQSRREGERLHQPECKLQNMCHARSALHVKQPCVVLFEQPCFITTRSKHYKLATSITNFRTHTKKKDYSMAPKRLQFLSHILKCTFKLGGGVESICIIRGKLILWDENRRRKWGRSFKFMAALVRVQQQGQKGAARYSQPDICLFSERICIQRKQASDNNFSQPRFTASVYLFTPPFKPSF